MKQATIFEPDEPNELLRGWLLHAHKGRDRHDLAARHYDQRRYLLGGTAAFISGIVGTSTFAALQSSTARAIQVVVGVLAIAAADRAVGGTRVPSCRRAAHHRPGIGPDPALPDGVAAAADRPAEAARGPHPDQLR